jgi:hypothetical protein
VNCTASLLREFPRTGITVSAQMMLRVSDHPGTHVLDYLAKCEHAAVIRSRRDLVQHYHECWLLVFERINGILPLPLAVRVDRPACPPPLPAPLKGWERDKYSKPMRKVLECTESVRTVPGSKAKYTVLVLRLECGHEIEEFTGIDPEKHPLRRRCVHCSNVRHAAQVETKRLQQEGPPK